MIREIEDLIYDERFIRLTSEDVASGLSTRRLQTVQYVIGALQKLAATRNCAVVLLSQCVTKMQSQNRGAALMPSISAGVWEQGLTTRIALFRDWMWKDGIPIDTRFVGIQRLAGKAVPGSGIQKVAAFRVESVRDQDASLHLQSPPPRLGFFFL